MNNVMGIIEHPDVPISIIINRVPDNPKYDTSVFIQDYDDSEEKIYAYWQAIEQYNDLEAAIADAIAESGGQDDPKLIAVFDLKEDVPIKYFFGGKEMVVKE